MRESRARRLKEKSRKYFDGVVRDQFMILEPGKCYQQVFEKLREFDINDGKIMDVGCGTGALLGILSEQLPGTDLYGLDISPVSIAAAREKVPAAHFDEGDGEDIPFPDEFAGAVYSLFSSFPGSGEGFAGDLPDHSKRRGFYSCGKQLFGPQTLCGEPLSEDPES